MAKFGQFKFGQRQFGRGLTGYTLRITPDLGWPDREAMFIAARNSTLLQLELADLQVVATEPVQRKSMDNLVFEIRGIKYKVSREQATGLGGSTRHFWRVEWETIQTFFLQRDAGRPTSAGVSRAKRSKVLR